MKHYICKGGCGGVAETPGTCQAADCPDYGKELKGCDCEDGQHSQMLKESEEE